MKAKLVFYTVFSFFALVLLSNCTSIDSKEKSRLLDKYKSDKPFLESEFFLTSDAVSLHYRYIKSDLACKGKILFLHGLGGSTASFPDLIEPLKNEAYDLLLVDFPAQGYSDRKAGLVHDTLHRSIWIEELVQFIDRTKADPLKKWNICAHSMGAKTLLLLNKRNNINIEKLIFISPALENSKKSPLLFFKGLISLYVELTLFTPKGVHDLLKSAYSAEPTNEKIDLYLAPFLVPGTANALSDMLLSQNDDDLSIDESISSRALFIWGEKDEWVPFEKSKKILEPLLDKKIVLVPLAGHCAMETHSKDIIRIMLSFFEF